MTRKGLKPIPSWVNGASRCRVRPASIPLDDVVPADCHLKTEGWRVEWGRAPSPSLISGEEMSSDLLPDAIRIVLTRCRNVLRIALNEAARPEDGPARADVLRMRIAEIDALFDGETDLERINALGVVAVD